MSALSIQCCDWPTWLWRARTANHITESRGLTFKLLFIFSRSPWPVLFDHPWSQSNGSCGIDYRSQFWLFCPSVRPSARPFVCLVTARHTFDLLSMTTTYLGSEWRWLDIPKRWSLKSFFNVFFFCFVTKIQCFYLKILRYDNAM